MAHSFEHLIEHVPVDARCEHSLAKDEILFRQQQPATVMRLNSHQLLAAISANKEPGMQFSRTLAAQVRDMRAMLSLRDIRSANEHLLAWLRMNTRGDQMTVFIDRPWTGVSEELGLTREAVYRALAHLQQQGRIERNGRQDGVQAETIHLLQR